MLICPVCRSQNMDTAKFCGNCGNPFPRPSEQTSSLINCPQGHIYSAIYQHCPYCPQVENNNASSFITRVEEQITTIEQQSKVAAPPQPSSRDFITRVEPPDTLFDTKEPPLVTPQPVEPPPSIFAPTELITSVQGFEPLMRPGKSMETTAKENGVEEKDKSPVYSPSLETLITPAVEPPAQAQAPTPAPAPLPPEPLPHPAAPPQSQESTTGTGTDTDRRTIVMAEQVAPARPERGKIVGWLITYNRNPDGEDFRVYAGYNRLGANPVCDMVIEDETVSGSHAIIVYREGRCLIKDDLSRNGTYVNGREISEAHPLQNYDQIRIGNTYLTFVAAERLS